MIKKSCPKTINLAMSSYRYLRDIFPSNIISKFRYEKLYRNDYKYDYFIPIKYNWKKPKSPKGSAIFIHLTKNYQPTNGCIALSTKDFLILAKLINKNTKIKIL